MTVHRRIYIFIYKHINVLTNPCLIVLMLGFKGRLGMVGFWHICIYTYMPVLLGFGHHYIYIYMCIVMYIYIYIQDKFAGRLTEHTDKLHHLQAGGVTGQGVSQAWLPNRWVVSCNIWMVREGELKYNVVVYYTRIMLIQHTYYIFKIRSTVRCWILIIHRGH